MSRIILITGASSGIGLATAELFLQKGDIVYTLSRRPCPLNNERHHALTGDVTDEAQIRRAVDTILTYEKRIDVLVNNAGFGISGTVEFAPLTDAQRQMDVNFFGQVRLIQAVLPAMRAQKSGCIINLSSVAAPLAVPFQAFYSASKAAINALTLALANEVRAFNIGVCAVMPGDASTGFTDVRAKTNAGSEVYPHMEKSVASMEKDERGGMPASCVAKRIYALSTKKHPKPLTTVGAQYKVFIVLQKLLPARFINWLEGKLYA